MSGAQLYAEPRFAPLPPTSYRSPRVEWLAAIPALLERPGQWAAIGTITERQSLGRRAETFRNRGIETTTRSNGDGTRTVWACYTAPADLEPQVESRGRLRCLADELYAAMAPQSRVGAPLVWSAS